MRSKKVATSPSIIPSSTKRGTQGRDSHGADHGLLEPRPQSTAERAAVAELVAGIGDFNRKLWTAGGMRFAHAAPMAPRASFLSSWRTSVCAILRACKTVAPPFCHSSNRLGCGCFCECCCRKYMRHGRSFKRVLCSGGLPSMQAGTCRCMRWYWSC
jgi:hypothetical protein